MFRDNYPYAQMAAMQHQRNMVPIIVSNQEYTSDDLKLPEVRPEIAHYSQSIRLLENLRKEKIDFSDLDWRQFEEIIAELLKVDGYDVELGPGRGDGGKDIFAYKYVAPVGLVAAVWQAKTKPSGKKVGISTIRELADTRAENKASKGVIATTTYLTDIALQRVSSTLAI